MDETRINAALQELSIGRTLAVNVIAERCAQLAADLAVAHQRIQELTAQVEAQAKELAELKPKTPEPPDLKSVA